MHKPLSIAVLAAVLALGTATISSAIDPAGGQSSSQLNSLDPQSGSPSESGKTGIGSTSGADASVETGLKATPQPVPCQSPGAMRSEVDAKAKAGQNTDKRSAADAAQEAMANIKTPDSSLDRDTARNPEARSNAETGNRMSGC